MKREYQGKVQSKVQKTAQTDVQTGVQTDDVESNVHGSVQGDAHGDAHRHVQETTETENKITFLASFPPIASAILRSGAGDGMQIKLSIPESEMGQAIRCQLWPGKILEITMRVLTNDEVQQFHQRQFQSQTRSEVGDEDSSEADNEADNGKRRTLKRSAPRRRIASSDNSE